MPSKVFSAAIIGIDAIPVEIEVDVSGGMHAFRIVGLPDKAVEESKERVSSALKNSGAKSPVKYNRRITVNLAPADLKKEGAGYDLGIAIGFLLASGQLFPFETEKKLFCGELSLEGRVRRTNGLLPIVEMAARRGFEEVFLPKGNAPEVNFIEHIRLVPVEKLDELILHLEGKRIIPALTPEKLETLISTSRRHASLDMSEIAGQEAAKRVLEIAAAGSHNVLFQGPPGTGKTLLARALPGILPPLALEEAVEVTKIYSVSGFLHQEEPLITLRPFRAPHHSASAVSIIGGGTNPKPGEASLAHRGVLFLDEFPEFPRSVLENLRQPMEDGFITVSRAKGTVTFPAKFMLVAAMNPCPCGWYGDPHHSCTCGLSQIIKYRQKLSGPLRDRIDLTIPVPRIDYDRLRKTEARENSETIQERVAAARRAQGERFRTRNQSHQKAIFSNAEMGPKEIRTFCDLLEPLHQMLRMAESKYGLSPRALHRIVKVSRTIADLAGSQEIKEEHLAEALQYREVAE